MNNFADYNKRDLRLPSGCKDLAGLLPHAQTGFAFKVPKRQTEGLRQLGEHLSKFLSSPSPHGMLSIAGFSLNAGLILENRKGLLEARVYFRANSPEESASRKCFEAAGLDPAEEEFVIQGRTARTLKYRIPLGETDLQELLADLLHTAFGATENAGLYYGYYSFPRSAR